MPIQKTLAPDLPSGRIRIMAVFLSPRVEVGGRYLLKVECHRLLSLRLRVHSVRLPTSTTRLRAHGKVRMKGSLSTSHPLSECPSRCGVCMIFLSYPLNRAPCERVWKSRAPSLLNNCWFWNQSSEISGAILWSYLQRTLTRRQLLDHSLKTTKRSPDQR